MKITCTDCGKRMDAKRCDSVAVVPNAPHTRFLGELVTVASERRRYFCGHCGGPNTKVEA